MRTLRDRYATLSRANARSWRGGRRAVEQAGRRRARHQRDHREGSPRQVMRKMHADSFAELVNIGRFAAARDALVTSV